MKAIVLRIVTALSTATLAVLGLLYLPERWVVMPALILLIAAVQLEFSQIIAKTREIYIWPGVIIGVAYMIARFYFHLPLGSEWVALALLWLIGSRRRGVVGAVGQTALALLYVTYLLSFLIVIIDRIGAMWLLYVIAMVKFSDMGGFAFGMSFGKHKMCPSISPKKSWEGLLGSVIAGMLMSLAFVGFTRFPIWEALLVGFVAALVGTFGDLVESKFKRIAGVKDSATFMPAGLGGFLDMFDSLMFAPLIFSLVFLSKIACQ